MLGLSLCHELLNPCSYHWGLMIGPKIDPGQPRPRVSSHRGCFGSTEAGAALYQAKEWDGLIPTRYTGGLGPNEEPTIFAVAAETAGNWRVSETYVRPFITNEDQPELLVRIAIAKVASPPLLRSLLLKTPARGAEDADWNSASWVKEALELVWRTPKVIGEEFLGSSVRNWQEVSAECMWYVGYKKGQHRWDGSRGFEATAVPTWDMMVSEEVVR